MKTLNALYDYIELRCSHQEPQERLLQESDFNNLRRKPPGPA